MNVYFLKPQTCVHGLIFLHFVSYSETFPPFNVSEKSQTPTFDR